MKKKKKNVPRLQTSPIKIGFWLILVFKFNLNLARLTTAFMIYDCTWDRDDRAHLYFKW